MKRVLFNHTVQYLESLMNEGRLSYTMLEKFAEFSLAMGELQLGGSNHYDGKSTEVMRVDSDTAALVRQMLMSDGK